MSECEKILGRDLSIGAGGVVEVPKSLEMLKLNELEMNWVSSEGKISIE